MIENKSARIFAGSLLAAAAITSAGVAVGAGAASAKPSVCSTTKTDATTGYSYCASGTGQHRFVATCTDGISGTSNTQYGPWVNVRELSIHTCYPEQRTKLTRLSYQTR